MLRSSSISLWLSPPRVGCGEVCLACLSGTASLSLSLSSRASRLPVETRSLFRGGDKRGDVSAIGLCMTTLPSGERGLLLPILSTDSIAEYSPLLVGLFVAPHEPTSCASLLRLQHTQYTHMTIRKKVISTLVTMVSSASHSDFINVHGWVTACFHAVLGACVVGAAVGADVGWYGLGSDVGVSVGWYVAPSFVGGAV